MSETSGQWARLGARNHVMHGAADEGLDVPEAAGLADTAAFEVIPFPGNPTTGASIASLSSAVRHRNTARGRTAEGATSLSPVADRPQAQVWCLYAQTQAAEKQARMSDAEEQLRRSLVRSGVSCEEARSRLLDAGLDEEQARGIIDRFRERGQLDDREFARQLVRRLRERRGYGVRHIRQRLRQRGMSASTVDAVLAEGAGGAGCEEDERDRARRTAQRRAPRLRQLEPEVALRRLVGFLQRRGYEPAIALQAAQGALKDFACSPEADGQEPVPPVRCDDA